MEIENKRGILDIDKDASLEIERTNPLFNDQGSASLPFSIVKSDHNNFVLGFPALYERKEQFEDKQPVNVRAGILNETGTLELLRTKDKIEGVIYLYESSFYNQAKQVKLSTVFDGIERWFQSSSVSREDRVKYILERLQNMITSYPDNTEDYTIFPAVIDAEVDATISSFEQPIVKPTETLNEIETVYSTELPEYRLKAKNSYTKTDSDGNTITIPVGYGVSPFLKVSYVLRKIFSYFGFNLEENIFDTDAKCSRWVVLNNTMDAIMPGYIIESQLVPDCTVNEFLDVIREMLCADFTINVSNKTAKIILFNDVLDSDPDVDLTPYLTKPYEEVEINKPKQIKLSVNKSLPFAGTPTDTLAEFIQKYADYNSTQPMAMQEGVFPFYNQNAIWRLYDPLPGWYGTIRADRLSSLNFDYDKTNDLEKEDHKIPLEALGTVLFYTDNRYSKFYAPVIGSMRNLNSYVVLDGTQITEEATTCPIMFSCEAWELPTRIGFQFNNNPYLSYHNSLLLWGDGGIYDRFWRRYSEQLKRSFHPVTHIARLPAYILNKYNFEKLKVINGQPLFPVSLKYKMENKDLIEVEMKFCTVKLYEMEDWDDERDNGNGGNIDTSGSGNGGGSGTNPDLEDLVGTWTMADGYNHTEGFTAKFTLNADYSGSIYLKNNSKTIDSTFDKLTLTKYNISRVLTLHTKSGDVVLTIMNRVEPDNSISLVWYENANVAVMIKN